MMASFLFSSETPNSSAQEERVERKKKENMSLPLPSSMAEPLAPSKLPKKRSRTLAVFRAAYFMAHRKSKGKSNKVSSLETDVIANRQEQIGLWRSLLGGVRPLHAQPPQIIDSPPRLPLPPPPPSPDQPFHDVLLRPPSPAASFPSSSSSSYDGMSRYASAENLRVPDVDEAEEDGEEDEEEEEGDGSPNLIDLQAEEFIARFYEQIRLQRVQ